MFAFKCLGITRGAGSTYKVHLRFIWMPRTLVLDNQQEPSRQINLAEDGGQEMFEVEFDGKEEAEKVKMMLDFQRVMIVVMTIAGGTRGTGGAGSPELLEDIADPDNEGSVQD